MATTRMFDTPQWPMKYRPRSVRVVKVIEVVVATGAGTPDDPFKLITEFWDQKGELLAQREGSPVDLQGIQVPRSDS